MIDTARSLSEANLRSILHRSPYGTYVVDAELRLAAANRAAMRMLGADPDAIGRGFEDVMHRLRPPAWADEVIRRFRHTLATGEPYVVSEADHAYEEPPGTACFEWQLDRIELADGRHGVLCNFRDVTAQVIARHEMTATAEGLRRSEEQLRRADRHKDEFLATLSHELRNPLAPLRHALTVLGQIEPASARTRPLLQTMERQVGQLVRMVDDLLEVSRISRGRIELRPEPVDVAALLRGAMETSQPLIDAARHRLEVSLSPGPLTVMADPLRISQVLSNLLNNAAKYTDPGGRIWLSVRREGDDAVISVRDDGVGIPAHALPHVFEMFVQVDHDHHRSQGGLGIGLAVVKSLVEMHGGTVEAKSAGVGEGSEVVVRLPVVQPLPAAPEPPPAPSSTRGSCRILVVDDNADAASMLGLLLEMLGNEVRVELDGRAALDALGSQRPHVVFLDLGMPGMSGYEVARHVRETPEHAGIKLVAVTGWGQAEDRRRTREAGFHHHLTKPVDLSVLEDLLASVSREACAQ